MELAESLKFAFRHGFSDEIARYFVHAYEQRESLQFAIAYSLEWVNVPDAVELVVRQAAKISAELEGTDKVSPWQLTLSSNWGRSGFSDRGFSDRCISRLKDLWDDPASDDFVRKWAFRFWLTSCDSKSIATLSGIEPASTNYRAALWKRAELSDLTSVQEILPLLESDLHWFLVAHNIWCEALVTATNQSINDHSSGMRTDKAGENTNASYLLSKLIMRIPADDAESLIVQNWDSIMYSSRFVQSALYTGTDKCLELVQEAVANCSHNESLFKGLASHYGLYAIGSRPLTRKQLEDMVPYIEYFDQPSLSELTGYCMRNGIQEWSRENLMPYLNEESRKRYYPNDSELQSELDDYLLRAGGSGQLWIDRWLEGFTERNDPPNRAMVLAETWLSKHLSVRALALVGEIIAISGSREDLAILFKYDIEGPQELIENTRENVSYAVHRRTIL
jgi:hypothetical protein